MHFVQSGFLLATAAVAIPVIVHLMFRSQARRVNLGTLRFLKQVLERNAQRQRIMRWMLLAMRMAAVALLAFLFARPYFVEAAPGGDRRLVMILIDRSASMDLKGDAGRLIDQALAEARSIVGNQPVRTRIEVAFFDDAVRPLGEGSQTADGHEAEQGNRDSVSRLLADAKVPAASFHATNYGAAINWARDLSIRAAAQSQVLHLFTDLQRSGLDWAEVDPLPASVEVHLHDLGRAVVNNLAVTEARPLRSVVRPGEATTLQATVLNSTAFPIAEQPVLLKLESPRGKVSLRERVKLESGSTGTVRFEIPSLDEGLWTGTVAIDGAAEDDLKFDNVRQVAILSAKPNRVLLLDGSPSPSPLLSETYFLATSLRLAGPEEAYADAPFDAVVAPLTADDEFPSLEGVRVVVLANVPEIQPAAANQLAEFVTAGGGLVVFGGDKVQPKGYEALASAGLVPGRVAGPVHASDLPFRLDAWNDKHPLLKPFADPQHGDLRRLSFRGYTKILVPTAEPADKTSASAAADDPSWDSNGGPIQIVARFRGGDPALIEQTFGKGRAVWFTSTCDRGWGDWPSSKLYLPLVHQIVGEPLGLNEGGPVRSVLIDAVRDADAAPAVLAKTGFSQVVNPSPRESETERCPPQEFAERFQLTLAKETGEPLVRPTAATVAASATDLRHDERWSWVAVALVGLLLAEGFVANRTVS